jgi:hypothetical protein
MLQSSKPRVLSALLPGRTSIIRPARLPALRRSGSGLPFFALLLFNHIQIDPISSSIHILFNCGIPDAIAKTAWTSLCDISESARRHETSTASPEYPSAAPAPPSRLYPPGNHRFAFRAILPDHVDCARTTSNPKLRETIMNTESTSTMTNALTFQWFTMHSTVFFIVVMFTDKYFFELCFALPNKRRQITRPHQYAGL